MAKQNSYYPYLDSLRAIACIFVIIFHSNITAFIRDEYHVSFFQGGYIGVDFFFTLSGFLITKILLKQFLLTGKINILNFYKKRLLRLYPPILVATIIFLIPYLFIDHRTALSNMFFLLTYTGDCVFLFQKLFPFLVYPSMFSHCWSLAVEEQFYIIFPVVFTIIMYFSEKHKRDNIIKTFIVFNILFIALVIYLPILLKAYFYKFFLWRFFEIFFGGFLAFIYSKEYQIKYSVSKVALNVVNFIHKVYENKYIGVISLLLFFVIFIINLSLTPFNIPIHYYLLTVLSSIIITNAYIGRNFIYIKILDNSLLKYLGKISYGLYLFHWPVFFFKRFNIINIDNTLLNVILYDAICLIIIFILAIISYEFIEKKFIIYKNRIYN